jgi:hypothetical protein
VNRAIYPEDIVTRRGKSEGTMGKLAKLVVERFTSAGTPLLLMGIMWLFLWVFPWYRAYVAEPHWGHNYAEALAFLCVGLAYFHRRFLSDVLAFLASLLVIFASLELLPHPVTAIAGGIIAALIIIDMVIERGRKDDLAQPANRRLAFWLKRHTMRFALIMLGHIALVYYLVRLPAGTYETELVTKVYDGMLLVFVMLALMEGAVQTLWGAAIQLLGFSWGMLTIIVALAILSSQPETWPFLGLSLIVVALAIASLVASRRSAGNPQDG